MKAPGPGRVGAELEERELGKALFGRTGQTSGQTQGQRRWHMRRRYGSQNMELLKVKTCKEPTNNPTHRIDTAHTGTHGHTQTHTGTCPMFSGSLIRHPDSQFSQAAAMAPGELLSGWHCQVHYKVSGSE